MPRAGCGVGDNQPKKYRRTGTMIQLDYHNLLIHSILTDRLSGDKHTPIDQTVSDFDGVTFHISTPERKSLILISLHIKCFSELVQYGARDYLASVYGRLVVETEKGYDFSVQVDLENAIEDATEREKLAMDIALLKRNAMAAPFLKAFAEYDELSLAAEKSGGRETERTNNNLMAIHYRDEEAIFIRPSHDRVTVIFSTVFREETDRIFGKVFLQEFVDARRRAIQNAPQVLYSNREPPMELRSAPGLLASDDIGYITFVLFPRHITETRRDDCVSQLQIFRDYFHFHIKCSKAYMHSRMRHRVSEFLKVLNRAKLENAEKERKTATGRTFIPVRR